MKTKTIYLLIFIMLISLGTSKIIYANENLQEVYKTLSLKIIKSNVENKTKLQNDILDLIYENKDILNKDNLLKIIENTKTAKIQATLQKYIDKQIKENEITIEEIKAYNNKKQSIFKGFFRNPDYSDPKVFLGHGEQSQITDTTYYLVASLNDKKDFTTLSDIYKRLSSFDKYDESVKKMELYDTYTTEDYIKDRKLYGCTTYSLVFANMARAKGIPTVIVEGLKVDFIKKVQAGKYDNHISGHFFTEVYIDNQWYLIDNTRGRLYLNYNTKNKILPNDNFLLGKGIDRWEFGMRMKEYSNKKSRFWDLVNSINLDKYENRTYKYIDLNNMVLIDQDFKKEIMGVTLENKIIYYFATGRDDKKFQEIIQNNIENISHGFSYNYLKNYDKYKNEADILFLSSNIPHHNLPKEIKDKMSKEKYHNLTTEFNLIEVQNADIFIVKSS